ncbi:hypothetical protein C8K30_1011119 [Promicromonospora sp. AC04]|nr:hypothetical protein C8K30_1011119 [Promicromonospora sp. AC04]
MDTAAHQIVSDYLDDLEHLLQHTDAASVAVMAPSELRRTVRALRAILADRAPDRRDQQHNGPIRRLWWQAWQQVCLAWAWQVAYQHLIAAPPADPTGPIGVVGGPR